MELPKTKTMRFDDRIGLPIEKDLKRRLYEAKKKHGFDFSEWLRTFIRQNLPEIEEQLKRGA